MKHKLNSYIIDIKSEMDSETFGFILRNIKLPTYETYA